MSAQYDLLRGALLARQSCFAVYDGHNRYFCPHVIGWKDRVEQVLCWQYAGQSSSPLPPNGQWKCLTIAKMSQLRLTGEPWHVGDPGKTGRPTNCVGQVDEMIPL